MRNMRNIMIEAHRMTKEIKNNSPEVDYKAQLGLCLSFLMMREGSCRRCLGYMV